MPTSATAEVTTLVKSKKKSTLNTTRQPGGYPCPSATISFPAGSGRASATPSAVPVSWSTRSSWL